MSECGVEMPRYRCHKEVWALQIAAIEFDLDRKEPNEEGEEGATITPAEKGYAPFRVSAEYVRKHKPQVGGYYVVYKDGYKSFSPADAFEEGYTRLDQYGRINERRKPTVEELEAILKEPNEPQIEIQPDGSIRAVPVAPSEAIQGPTP
jgi:hypothetical protein